ncbi:MAG: hypothetical protein NVSMB3_03860 [Acidobacteriaceae bacterium]
MRRLLQLGSFLLILTAFVTPVIEAFDRWDLPGIGNDTEMAVFCVIFVLCLVLLVYRVIGSLACRVPRISGRQPRWDQAVGRADEIVIRSCFLPPPLASPLRI